MKNKMTAKERMDAEARLAAITAEAKRIRKGLKEDDAKTDSADVEEVLVEETLVEAEVAEEVTEEETPVEAEDAEEVTEEDTPVEAEEDNGECVCIVGGETEDKTSGFAKVLKWIIGTVASVALVGIMIMLILMYKGKNDQITDPGADNPNNDIVDNVPGDTVVEFDMDAFVTSVTSIANTLTTDEDIATNADILADKIGADKLSELVGKYGELTVQKAVAEYLAFVPEIKMNQYINNKGLAYNPNAVDDYYQNLLDADNAYMEATGKNPNGALMSLEGYDTHKSNREAMKALIIESGDTALLTWYEAKTTGYDTMAQQTNDTETALVYKEEVKLEIINNVNGSVKLLELQLEQNVNGTNAETLEYTDVYAEFIINNYMYVVAN